MLSYRLKYWGLFILPAFILVSCHPGTAQKALNNATVVKDSVTNLVLHIQKDINTKGPSAWLNYFENSPDFFMASDGQLAFKDYQSAKTVIQNTLVKNIKSIKLRYINLRIDVPAPSAATVGADFHEDLIDFSGKSVTVDGYFTATAHYDGKNWKLRNLHWSVKH